VSSLVARDALSDRCRRVSAEGRPPVLDGVHPRETVYAVFESLEAPAAAERFLGLVDSRSALLYPYRIFADLVSSWQPAPLSADTPLDVVLQRLLEDAVAALAVVDPQGRLLGAVTRESVFAALVQQERRASADLQQQLDLRVRQFGLIAFEIHDGLLQYATAALMHFQSFVHLKNHGEEQAEVDLIRGMTLLHESIREARSLMDGLRMPAYSSLPEALETLLETRRTPQGPRLELTVDALPPQLPESYHLAIFRMAQEALANALKHSGASRIEVHVCGRDDALALTVRDSGRGFDPEQVRRGYGLAGLQHRARLLDGTCEVHSAPGKGTTICVTLPAPRRRS